MKQASCTLWGTAFAVLLLSGCAAERRDAAETAALPDDAIEHPSETPPSPPEASDTPPVSDPLPADVKSVEVESSDDLVPMLPPGEQPEPALPEVLPYRLAEPSTEVLPLEVPTPLSPDEPDALAPALRSINPIRDEEGPLDARLQPRAMMIQAAPEYQMPETTAAPMLPLEVAPDPASGPEPEPDLPDTTLLEPGLPPSADVLPEPDPGLLAEDGVPAPPPTLHAVESPPESIQPATTAELEPEVEETYTVVRVFYGTDRNALAVPLKGQPQQLGWAALIACAATATLLLGLAALRFPSRRVLRWCAVASIVCTVLLGGITLFAGLHSRMAATGESEHHPVPVTRVAYGNRRGTLEYGVCEVSIPKGHKVGQLEAPSIFRLEFHETPERHVVLMGVEPLEPDAFFGTLKARIEESEAKSAFVFVHGFNVTFEDAARRTAQIAYDLKFDGAPIFFSWPSQGGLFKYTIDETNVMWTVPHLREFLTEIAERTGARRIHLVAHSMGNRALTAALRDMSFLPEDRRPRFSEVVLTAPDIDAEVFRRDIAPYIVQTADRVTLYASSNDTALAYSKTVHGYPRAGDSGRELLVLPGMDTVDVSEIDTSLLGHSYYGSNETVLADLIEVLHKSLPPQQRRWLRPVQVGTLEYWVFQR